MTMTERGHKARMVLFAAGLGALLVAPRPIMSQSGPLTTKIVTFGSIQRLGGNKDFNPSTEQTEPAIAVNPINPMNLVAGFHDSSNNFLNTSVCHVAFSMDGGLTWSSGGSVPLQDAQNHCYDSSIAADLNGVFYYAHLDKSSQPNVASGITVARSTDGGRSFPFFSVAAAEDGSHIVDKPYMAADAHGKSRFKGALYVAYATFATNIFQNSINVVVSRDAGTTWSGPVPVASATPSGSTEIEGPVPVVASDGTVYIFFAKFNGTETSIQFVKSTDGGDGWSTPADVAANLPTPGSFLLKNADPKFGSGTSAGVFANSLPTAAVAPDGTLFVAWVDFSRGSCNQLSSLPACVNADIRLAVSRNDGKSWSPPVKVSDETNATDQFQPWITTHPDGLLSIVWLDKRLDPSNQNFDTFYANTYDGSHFLPNVRVSATTSVIGTNMFIGDYQGIVATADAVFPIWNGVQNGNPAIFTSIGRLAP